MPTQNIQNPFSEKSQNILNVNVKAPRNGYVSNNVTKTQLTQRQFNSTVQYITNIDHKANKKPEKENSQMFSIPMSKRNSGYFNKTNRLNLNSQHSQRGVADFNQTNTFDHFRVKRVGSSNNSLNRVLSQSIN